MPSTAKASLKNSSLNFKNEGVSLHTLALLSSVPVSRQRYLNVFVYVYVFVFVYVNVHVVVKTVHVPCSSWYPAP